MIVRVDLAAGAPAVVVLVDADDTGRFHVEVRGGDAAAVLDTALRKAGVGWSADEGHAFVLVDAVRRLAAEAGAASAKWDEGLSGMLAYAASKGWLAPDGDAIRAHVQLS